MTLNISLYHEEAFPSMDKEIMNVDEDECFLVQKIVHLGFSVLKFVPSKDGN